MFPIGTPEPVEPTPRQGTHDGQGAADNNQPYTYHKPTVEWPYPFTLVQLGLLMILRVKHEGMGKRVMS